jgi:hypothetical protein
MNWLELFVDSDNVSKKILNQLIYFFYKNITTLDLIKLIYSD